MSAPPPRNHGAGLGGLQLVAGAPFLPPETTEQFAQELLYGHGAKLTELAETGEVDLSHERPGVRRFRVSIFRQRGALSIVLRVVPAKVLTLEELGLPPAVSRL